MKTFQSRSIISDLILSLLHSVEECVLVYCSSAPTFPPTAIKLICILVSAEDLKLNLYVQCVVCVRISKRWRP